MKAGIYKHYKGNLYEVIRVVYNTETREPMVLYKALYECPDLTAQYGNPSWFVRPLNMFTEEVEIDGVKTPRFEYLSETVTS